MLRQIPQGSVEVQEGLFAYLDSFDVNGVVYSRYKIYSEDGYHFYNADQPENYDEDGNLKPYEERVYLQYCATVCTTLEEVNAHFVSSPI